MPEKKPEVGQMLRGQAWVELHGIFTRKRLQDLVDKLGKNCRGLERKDMDVLSR
jgi:hypothetical protein